MSTRKFTFPAALAAIMVFAVPVFAAQHPASSSALPATLRPALYQALAKDAGPAYAIGKDGCATLPKQSLTACFTKGGARFSGKNAPALALHLASYGRGDQLMPVKLVAPTIQANRAAYEHGNVTEWWRVLPMGFEQGFTVAKRPNGNGELTLTLAANRAASSHGGDLAWGKLSYGKLIVTDAKGYVVPATLKSEGDRILIAVNDAHAAYPLTVDPLVWIEQKVTADDGDFGHLGTSVAVSGTTAIIGARGESDDEADTNGAAYVFSESGGTWTQSAKLTASDGNVNDLFGYSVAIDGGTALIGAPQATVNGIHQEGAVYVFTESDGAWNQTAKLTVQDGVADYSFGISVALHETTALIGAVGGAPVPGSVYAFSNSGGTWSQTQKLAPDDSAVSDEFGYSLALDGSSVLIGAPAADINGNSHQGAAYVFTETGGTWAQTQKLTADDGATGDYFSMAVALDGTSALVGVPFAWVNGKIKQGAAYVFDNSGGTWSEVQKLTASDGEETDEFGSALALNGASAFVGAPYTSGSNGYQLGEVYMFTDSGGVWNQTRTFEPSDANEAVLADEFGSSLGISGSALLVGADDENGEAGAAYFYGQSDLGLAVSAPDTVGQGEEYVSQTIATNDASASSPAVTATMTLPPAAVSFISATASQGSCSEASRIVTCNFGQINGNAGTATADVTLKATGGRDTVIENTASVAKATPALTASAPTTIATGTPCPLEYTEYDGNLDPGGRANTPPYQAPGGQENAILTAPSGFQLYAVFQKGRERKIYRVPGNEVHRRGLRGTYTWAVRAGSSGGAYMLCINHP